MSITGASAIGDRAVFNPQEPIQPSRSLCSLAKAIVSWVYGNLVALWNRVFCCSKGALQSKVIALQPQATGPELISRTNGSTVDPRVNLILDQAMDEIRAALSQETNFPNKTLIAVRIEGKLTHPFVGAINMNLTQVPKSFAWHETLHTRMRDYLIKNQVTKFEIGLCIGTDAGCGLYNVKVLQKQVGLEHSGASSGLAYASYGGMSFAGIKVLLGKKYPIFHVIANRVEDVLAENAVPKVW